MSEERPVTVKLPSREEMAKRFSGESALVQLFHPFCASNAEEEKTAIGILLIINFASTRVAGTIDRAAPYVLKFGPKIVDLLVDNPKMNEYVKTLIRQEFARQGE